MDYDFNVDLGQLRALIKRYPEVTMNETMAVVGLIAQRLETVVAEKTPTGVGGEAGLRGSIHGETARRGDVVRGQVSTPLEYGEVVEMGRRPNQAMPPIGPIMLWAQRKLGLDAKEAKSAAFAIARKIARSGFEGAHMFAEGLNELDSWIMRTLDTIPQRIVEKVGNGV